jgi:hypothetical protein
MQSKKPAESGLRKPDFQILPPLSVLKIRDCSPGPIESTTARPELHASMSRRASPFAAGGDTSLQCLPPSVVRSTDPASPLTHATCG